MQAGSPNGRFTDVRPVDHLVHAVEGQPDDDFRLEVKTSGEKSTPAPSRVNRDGGTNTGKEEFQPDLHHGQNEDPKQESSSEESYKDIGTRF